MKARVRLDHAGIEAVLKSEPVRTRVFGLAQRVAQAAAAHAAVQRHEVPVRVDTYTTDRAAAAVVLAHPGGLWIQAKYGVLSAAAGAAGLSVSQKKNRRKRR